MCLLVSLQRSVAGVQRAYGLHHRRSADVELWCRRNDLYPLERSAAAPAGLPHHDQRPHGSCVHQVPAGLDHLGRPRHHLSLGSDYFLKFLFAPADKSGVFS